MKILEIRDRDDCFDGGLQKEIVIDETIEEQFIRHLADKGTLQYFSSFAKPFFRFDAPEGFVLKGIQGRNCFQITTSKSDPEGCLQRVRDIVESFTRRVSSHVQP